MGSLPTWDPWQPLDGDVPEGEPFGLIFLVEDGSGLADLAPSFSVPPMDDATLDAYEQAGARYRDFARGKPI